MNERIQHLSRLPAKTRKERDCAAAVLRHLDQYPFAVKTPLATPTPQFAAQTLPEGSVFFRQPFPRVHEAVWLFDSKEARDAFLDTYVGEEISR